MAHLHCLVVVCLHSIIFCTHFFTAFSTVEAIGFQFILCILKLFLFVRIVFCFIDNLDLAVACEEAMRVAFAMGFGFIDGFVRGLFGRFIGNGFLVEIIIRK